MRCCGSTNRACNGCSPICCSTAATPPRQQIAFTLWPDTNEEQALKNLRTLLTRLRQTQPELDRFLEVGVYALHWRPDAPCSLDVAGFEAACADAVAAAQRGETDAAIAAYGHAVQLYTGDLTPGWYDEWIVPERERLRQTYLDALEQLAYLLEPRGACATRWAMPSSCSAPTRSTRQAIAS